MMTPSHAADNAQSRRPVSSQYVHGAAQRCTVEDHKRAVRSSAPRPWKQSRLSNFLFREPGVHGAILTEALASRFDVHIEVTTDFDLAKHLGVPAAAVNAAIALNNDLAAGKLTSAPQLRELLGFARVRKALGLPAAIANLAGRATDDDRPDVISALTQHFCTTVTPLSLGKQR